MLADKRKGFTLIEMLVATIIIFIVAIFLAKGLLELMRYNLRVQVRQTAIQAVESWASYIESLPYDSWLINPGENNEDPPNVGGNALYCYDCAFNRGFCDRVPRNWETNTVCQNPRDPNCHLCSFTDPNYTPPFSRTARPYDDDADGIISLVDPYFGNNNCRDGQAQCDDANMKYRAPTSFIAGHLRLLPDWGQGSDDCSCRLGNCLPACREGSGWRSPDGSWNFRIRKDCLGGLKCTYEVNRGVSGGGVGWDPGVGNRVYVGMTVINYYYIHNPVKPAGKAIGIIAWYFDPVDRRYRAVTKLVFKERP